MFNIIKKYSANFSECDTYKENILPIGVYTISGQDLAAILFM